MKTLRKVLVMVLFVFMLTGCIGESTTYTICFDTQGGSKVENIVIEKGESFTLPEMPTKEGYEFAGWYTDSQFDKQYLEGTSVSKSITLYAKWVKVCTVTFAAGFEDVEIDDVVLHEGEVVAKPKVNYAGWLLQGWYTDVECENPYDFTKPVNADLKLYAKWLSADTAYTVTFVGADVEPINVQIGSVCERPEDPAKDNFAFYGWYLEEEWEHEYTFEEEVYADVTLYACFIQDTFVLQTRQNASFVEFAAKKADASGDETTFMVRTNDYLVGDDNAVKFAPITQLGTDYDYDTEEFGTTYYGAWKYNYDLFVEVEGVYEAVNKENYVDSFDEATAGIDFNETALNKKFKVAVYPQLLTELQNAADYTVVYYVKVIDGYNVYQAKELGYIDNRSAACHQQSFALDAWANFKLANDMDVNLCPTSIILQDDIQVTLADFPAEFLWSADELASTDSDYARALGSLKDYVDIYYRYVGENQEFNIFGNYFNIDASLIPCVVRENDEITAEGTAISHSQLLFTQGTSTSITSTQDVSFLGNAPKVQNVQKAGGLILQKVQGSIHTTKNTVSNGWFITYFPNYTNDAYVVDSCKAYDAFNAFIYNWGSGNVTIKNTIMKSCGGPIIISDHVHPENGDNYVGRTTFENCDMESYVTGEEGWFAVMGVSTLVPVVKSLDAIFNQAGKSFLKTQTDGTNTYTYMDMISVNKSGNAQTATSEVVKGSIKIDNKSAFCFGEDNPYLAAMLTNCFQAGAPVFQGDNSTSITGYCYFNGSALIDITGQPISEYSLFAADYFVLYYNGMMITLRLFNMGETL